MLQANLWETFPFNSGRRYFFLCQQQSLVDSNPALISKVQSVLSAVLSSSCHGNSPQQRAGETPLRFLTAGRAAISAIAINEQQWFL